MESRVLPSCFHLVPEMHAILFTPEENREFPSVSFSRRHNTDATSTNDMDGLSTQFVQI